MHELRKEAAHQARPLVGEVGDDLVENLVLRCEVVVEGGRGHARLSGDIRYRDLVRGLHCEQIDRRGEDLVPP